MMETAPPRVGVFHVERARGRHPRARRIRV